MAWWDATQAKAAICQFMHELTQQENVRLLWESNLGKTKVHMQRPLRQSLAKRQKDQTKIRVSEPRTHFPLIWNMLSKFLKKTTQKATSYPQHVVSELQERDNW